MRTWPLLAPILGVGLLLATTPARAQSAPVIPQIQVQTQLDQSRRFDVQISKTTVVSPAAAAPRPATVVPRVTSLAPAPAMPAPRPTAIGPARPPEMMSVGAWAKKTDQLRSIARQIRAAKARRADLVFRINRAGLAVALRVNDSEDDPEQLRRDIIQVDREIARLVERRDWLRREIELEKKASEEEAKRATAPPPSSAAPSVPAQRDEASQPRLDASGAQSRINSTISSGLRGFR